MSTMIPLYLAIVINDDIRTHVTIERAVLAEPRATVQPRHSLNPKTHKEPQKPQKSPRLQLTPNRRHNHVQRSVSHWQGASGAWGSDHRPRWSSLRVTALIATARADTETTRPDHAHELRPKRTAGPK